MGLKWFAMMLGSIMLAGPAAAATGPREFVADSLGHRKLIAEVSQRLLAVADPKAGLEWPPFIHFEEEGELVAYCTREDEWVAIHISSGMMEQVVEGQEDRLAMILGHEMSHALLGHLEDLPTDSSEASRADSLTPFVYAAFGRHQEVAADSLGMRLLLAAGYSFRGGRSVIKRMRDLGVEYTSFEGAGLGHPSWVERATYLDSTQAQLWRAIGAFENGTVFLMIEQYAAAARAFQSVVAEENFPGCAEAWANLGHALLMQYCDGLDPEDVRRFEIGQLVTTGFYRRPASLEAQVRGVDRDLWWDAVGALERAIRLDDGLTLARTDLGIAYLIGPAGRDVGQATRHLTVAADAAMKDESLDPLVRAAILLNAGVVDIAANRAAQGQDRLVIVERELNRYAESEGYASARQWEFGVVYESFVFNEAVLLASSGALEDQQKAVKWLRAYLANANRASVWWALAQDRYTRLCAAMGVPAESFDSNPGNSESTAFRPVVSVTASGKGEISLTDRLEQIQGRLGAGGLVRLVPGTNLKQLRYPELGLDLLAAEEVIAIVLEDSKAPSVTLRGTGTGSKSHVLRVGMSVKELEAIMGERPFDVEGLLDEQTLYRFYRGLGIGVRIVDASIAEIVVARVPVRE